ncbi:MAG: Gfo/Idh/MocA family oxidoreductase [Sedimentisphaerales bacterium]|nr:Gfo/Idh/MocA family oxidoreductase [Sedimentisphaerales bacterium]
MMNQWTRRSFLKSTAFGISAVLLPFSNVLGANDNIRLAVIGLHNQGSNHVNWFGRIPGVKIAALCDPDQAVLAREAKKFAERNETVATHTDLRRILDDTSIDAVVIAAPNHWHALATIWACQAGKDVYVEKPVCHNITEGRRMVEAARKYNRIVQSGMQRRSDSGLQEAIHYLQAGHLGKIILARGLCYVRRDSIGKIVGPQPIPDSLDYNLWTGPAPLAPLLRTRLHYDWHWVWPTGNGDLGNNGIHFMDVCRWVIGQQRLADRVYCVGGRFGYVDDGETPNTQVVMLEYDDAPPIVYEVRGLPRAKGDSAMDHYRDIRIDVVIHCEGGYLAGGWIYDKDGKKVKAFPRDGGGGHHANFIQAIRSRKSSDLNADVLEGHLSSSLCHMGNISYRLGRQASVDEVRASYSDNSILQDCVERMESHLAANQVDLKITPRILGPLLACNSQTERFSGPLSKRANALLSREYRKPFMVPEQV